MTDIRYSRSAIALHWAIAILLLLQLGLGWHMTSMAKGGTMFAAYQFHKSVGILILGLSLFRLAIRFLKQRPAPVKAGRLPNMLARSAHLGLYVFMVGAPVTGWAVVSTAKIAIPTRLFGVVPLPALPIGQGWHDTTEWSHWALAWLGICLILLHIGGAIRHHIQVNAARTQVHENVIGRMIPMAHDHLPDHRKILLACVAVVLLSGAFLVPRVAYPDNVNADKTQPDRFARPSAALTVSPVTTAQTAPVAAPSPEASSSPASDVSPAPAKWDVESGGSLGFTASVNGAGINGQFARWSADVVFDPDALADSRITVRVPLVSASTADADRDLILKGPNFFGSVEGPAVFRATKIRKIAGDRYSADGSLTMNGTSHPVALAFTVKIVGDKATVSGSSRIDRTAFEIGTGEWLSTDQIAAQVNISFGFKAHRAHQD